MNTYYNDITLSHYLLLRNMFGVVITIVQGRQRPTQISPWNDRDWSQFMRLDVEDAQSYIFT